MTASDRSLLSIFMNGVVQMSMKYVVLHFFINTRFEISFQCAEHWYDRVAVDLDGVVACQNRASRRIDQKNVMTLSMQRIDRIGDCMKYWFDSLIDLLALLT